MSKPLQWVIGICVVLATAAVMAALVSPLFLPQASWGSPGGMMGLGNMMGGWGMMGLGMFGMWLWPVLLIGLTVWGIAAVVQGIWRRPETPRTANAASGICRQCGQPSAAGWKVCPYCGQQL